MTEVDLAPRTYKRSAPPEDLPVPSSPEVVRHVGEQHDDGLHSVFCPCGHALLAVCVTCAEAAYTLAEAGTFCEHVQMVVAHGVPWRWWPSRCEP